MLAQTPGAAIPSLPGTETTYKPAPLAPAPPALDLRAVAVVTVLFLLFPLAVVVLSPEGGSPQPTT